jgi:hypothetical protein
MITLTKNDLSSNRSPVWYMTYTLVSRRVKHQVSSETKHLVTEHLRDMLWVVADPARELINDHLNSR